MLYRGHDTRGQEEWADVTQQRISEHLGFSWGSGIAARLRNIS